MDIFEFFAQKRVLVVIATLAVVLVAVIAGSRSEQSADNDLVKIIRVIDGDTAELEDGQIVRYIGIDAPETVDPREPIGCFGAEASAKNRELAEGKMARLEKDITDQDKYGRLLRYVWIEDALINLELVKQGFAYSYSYPPDVKYQDELADAQEKARGAERGLWGACPAAGAGD